MQPRVSRTTPHMLIRPLPSRQREHTQREHLSEQDEEHEIATRREKFHNQSYKNHELRIRTDTLHRRLGGKHPVAPRSGGQEALRNKEKGARNTTHINLSNRNMSTR